uniref:Mitochondrial carrier protein n=1 Tax=Eucampia antarctica TaxID=49252 RepID=A0A7S2W713_9STRA|mmetsp:Transcript_22074/g.21214  ORF Transcript_22074/g.21214 Transcript_22074/m.21214 type:complete len:308 (+) Transcript_22074:292-1215(+)
MLTAPLDLLKIRWQLGKEGSMFQTVENMVRKEGGVSSLYRGNVAATYLWVGYAVIQFSLYERTHAWLSHSQLERPKSSLKLPPLIKPIHNWIGSNPTATAFCAGGTAGICATMATYPFDIARTTFAAQGLTDATTKTASSLGFKPPRSLLEFGKQTFQKNGIRGFFVGSGPAILQIIPYMGINFALYDYLSSNQKCINVSQSGWAGAIAGGTSKLLVYPLDTVKKRLQAQAYFGQQPYKQNMLDCMVYIAKNEGIASFYKGLVPSVIKSMAATGFTFAFYAFAKKNLETIHDSLNNRNQPSPQSSRK